MAQQAAFVPRQTGAMGCLVILLALILATMLAGPLGFVVALVLIVGWAVFTGSLRLLWNLLLVPYHVLRGLTRRN